MTEDADFEAFVAETAELAREIERATPPEDTDAMIAKIFENVEIVDDETSAEPGAGPPAPE